MYLLLANTSILNVLDANTGAAGWNELHNFLWFIQSFDECMICSYDTFFWVHNLKDGVKSLRLFGLKIHALLYAMLNSGAFGLQVVSFWVYIFILKHTILVLGYMWRDRMALLYVNNLSFFLLQSLFLAKIPLVPFLPWLSMDNCGILFANGAANSNGCLLYSNNILLHFKF